MFLIALLYILITFISAAFPAIIVFLIAWFLHKNNYDDYDQSQRNLIDICSD